MSRLRTFIAVDTGKAIRDRAVALQEHLARTGADVKWVEPENLHVTLLFLGEVGERDVPPVCKCVSERLRQNGCLPDEHRNGRLFSQSCAGRVSCG